jgi:hypothetical protein
LKNQYRHFKESGVTIIQVDEAMITKKTKPLLEWSNRRENMQYDLGKINTKAIAIIAGVS